MVFKNSAGPSGWYRGRTGRPPIPNSRRQEIARRIRRGEPYRHIAEMCNVSIGTVANIAREHNNPA